MEIGYARSVAFTVVGDPKPQGSITAVVVAVVPAPKSRVRCPRCKTPLRGIVNMISDNPGTKHWRDLVATGARVVMDGQRVMTGAVTVHLDVAIARPASHYRTGRFAHLLRDDSRREPTGPKDGDLDKIARSTGDAMTGVVYADDCLVVEYGRLRMYWAGEKRDGLELPGARIIVTET